MFGFNKLKSLVTLGFTLSFSGRHLDNLFECPGLWIVGQDKDSSYQKDNQPEVHFTSSQHNIMFGQALYYVFSDVYLRKISSST
jgi:hypothetical protein